MITIALSKRLKRNLGELDTIKFILDRTADVMCGRHHALPYEEQNKTNAAKGDFQLDRGNDNFMHLKVGEGTITINYRYGLRWSKEKWEAYATVIKDALRCNPEDDN